MKKTIALIAFLFIGSSLLAQNRKTCNKPEQFVNDFNSVNKCLINSTKEVDSTASSEASDKAYVSKRRYYARRKTYLSSQIGKFNGKGTLSVAAVLENSKTQKLKEKEEKVVEYNRGVFDFDSVDRIPLFKSCKKTNKSNFKSCFNTNLNSFINKRIKYPKKAIKKGIIGDVNVKFRINKEGKVDNIQISAPKDDRILKKEVARVIERLPRFEPAERNGQKAEAEFSFKINFSL